MYRNTCTKLASTRNVSPEVFVVTFHACIYTIQISMSMMVDGYLLCKPLLANILLHRPHDLYMYDTFYLLACVASKFKSALSNNETCRVCPLNSMSSQSGAAVCPCNPGYLRPALQPAQDCIRKWEYFYMIVREYFYMIVSTWVRRKGCHKMPLIYVVRLS